MKTKEILTLSDALMFAMQRDKKIRLEFSDLAAEKRAAEKQWKKREQTITRAFTAVSRMGGSFESILGGGEFVKLETNEQRQLE